MRNDDQRRRYGRGEGDFDTGSRDEYGRQGGGFRERGPQYDQPSAFESQHNRQGQYGRSNRSEGGAERFGRDNWAGRDMHYGQGGGSGPQTGYGGYEGEYGAYDRYNRGGQGGYGTGARQGGEAGGYQRGGSYGAQRSMPKGYTRSDERIREDVCEHLSRSGLDVGEVSVDVSNGRVTLEGTVKDRHVKHAIEDCADDCIGVQDVDNRIRVQRESSASSAQGSSGGQDTSVAGNKKARNQQ